MMAALRYSVEEALSSLWRGRRSAVLSVGTITLALFVLGAFLLVTTNLEGLADEWRQSAELSVFLADDATENDRAAVEALLAPGPVVTRHAFISKVEALKRFREMFGELAPAADALESNPLPASFEVRLQPGVSPASVDQLATALRASRGVSDVRYDRQWLDRLLSAVAIIRRVGLVLGAILTLAAALTVANVVRLALYARRDEIDIMRLVGAPTAYVRGPFVVEGLIQGGLGGVLALLILAVAFVATRGAYLQPAAAALSLSALRFLPLTSCVYLSLGGMFVGCLGGILATRSEVGG